MTCAADLLAILLVTLVKEILTSMGFTKSDKS